MACLSQETFLSATATPSGRAPTRPIPTRKNHASVCVTCTPLLRRRRKSSQSTASQSQGTTLAKSCPLFEETWNTNRLCTENERKCRIHAQMQARTQLAASTQRSHTSWQTPIKEFIACKLGDLAEFAYAARHSFKCSTPQHWYSELRRLLFGNNFRLSCRCRCGRSGHANFPLFRQLVHHFFEPATAVSSAWGRIVYM